MTIAKILSGISTRSNEEKSAQIKKEMVNFMHFNYLCYRRCWFFISYLISENNELLHFFIVLKNGKKVCSYTSVMFDFNTSINTPCINQHLLIRIAEYIFESGNNC